MTKAERAQGEALKAERVAALKALGHSGEREKHGKGLLRHLSTFGLVYEQTARSLLSGLSTAAFRALVLPDRWIENPVFSTAPEVPVYDPRTLLMIKRALDENDSVWLEQCRQFVGAHRAERDEQVREELASLQGPCAVPTLWPLMNFAARSQMPSN